MRPTQLYSLALWAGLVGLDTGQPGCQHSANTPRMVVWKGHRDWSMSFTAQVMFVLSQGALVGKWECCGQGVQQGGKQQAVTASQAWALSDTMKKLVVSDCQLA